MTRTIDWTPDRVQTLQEVMAEGVSYSEAAHKLTELWGRRITYTMVRQACKRHNVPSMREDSGTYGWDIEDDGDAVLTLGDAAGARKMTVKDSGGNAMATIDSDGTLANNGFVQLGPISTLTIAAGVITATGSLHSVEIEVPLDGTDDLDTINGGSSGALLILRRATSGHSVVLRDASVGGGNLVLANDASCTLGASGDLILLVRISTLWMEICRAENN